MEVRLPVVCENVKHKFISECGGGVQTTSKPASDKERWTRVI